MRTPSLKTVILCSAISAASLHNCNSQSSEKGVGDFPRASIDILNAKIQQHQDSIHTATYGPSLLEKNNKSIVEVQNIFQFYIPDYITQQLQNTNSIPQSSEIHTPPIIKKVSVETAVNLIYNPRKKSDTLTIYQVVGSKIPFNYGKSFDKKYIFRHGSAGDDKSLVRTGHNEGLFAYAILRNGTVIQFFDDKKGLGAIGGFGAVDNNALSNFQGIAVEFSAKLNAQKTDVIEPNEAQLHSALLLKKHLEHKHAITGSYTSRQAVQFTPQQYEKQVHYDTKTWSDEIIQTLGATQELTPPVFPPHDIKERLALSAKLRKRNGTQDSAYVKMVKQYLQSRKGYPTDIAQNNQNKNTIPLFPIENPEEQSGH